MKKLKIAEKQTSIRKFIIFAVIVLAAILALSFALKPQKQSIQLPAIPEQAPEQAAFNLGPDCALGIAGSVSPIVGTGIQVVNFIMNPEGSAIGILKSLPLGTLGVSYGQLELLAKSPTALAKSQAYNTVVKEIAKSDPAVGAAIDSCTNAREKFMQDPASGKKVASLEIDENKKITSEINGITRESGDTEIDKLKANLPKGTKVEKSKDGVYTITFNQLTKEASVGDFKLSNLDKGSEFKYNEQTGDLSLNKGSIEISGKQYSNLQKATFTVKNKQIEFADFDVSAKTSYEFDYNNEKLLVDAEKGGHVKFDPKNSKKIEGKLALVSYKGQIINGEFTADLDSNGNIIKVTLLKKGSSYTFEDYLVRATAEKAEIYFDGKEHQGNYISFSKDKILLGGSIELNRYVDVNGIQVVKYTLAGTGNTFAEIDRKDTLDTIMVKTGKADLIAGRVPGYPSGTLLSLSANKYVDLTDSGDLAYGTFSTVNGIIQKSVAGKMQTDIAKLLGLNLTPEKLKEYVSLRAEIYDAKGDKAKLSALAKEHPELLDQFPELKSAIAAEQLQVKTAEFNKETELIKGKELSSDEKIKEYTQLKQKYSEDKFQNIIDWNIAEEYTKSGKTADADRLYKKVYSNEAKKLKEYISENPDDIEAKLNYATITKNLGDSGAEGLYKEVIILSDNILTSEKATSDEKLSAKKAKASSLMQLFDYKGAITEYESLAKENDKSIRETAYANLGILYIQNGDKEKAVESFQRFGALTEDADLKKAAGLKSNNINLELLAEYNQKAFKGDAEYGKKARQIYNQLGGDEKFSETIADSMAVLKGDLSVYYKGKIPEATIAELKNYENSLLTIESRYVGLTEDQLTAEQEKVTKETRIKYDSLVKTDAVAAGIKRQELYQNDIILKSLEDARQKSTDTLNELESLPANQKELFTDYNALKGRKESEILNIDIEIAKRRNALTGEDNPNLHVDDIINLQNKIYEIKKTENSVVSSIPFLNKVVYSSKEREISKLSSELEQKGYDWNRAYEGAITNGPLSINDRVFNPNTGKYGDIGDALSATAISGPITDTILMFGAGKVAGLATQKLSTSILAATPEAIAKSKLKAYAVNVFTKEGLKYSVPRFVTTTGTSAVTFHTYTNAANVLMDQPADFSAAGYANSFATFALLGAGSLGTQKAIGEGFKTGLDYAPITRTGRIVGVIAKPTVSTLGLTAMQSADQYFATGELGWNDLGVITIQNAAFVAALEAPGFKKTLKEIDAPIKYKNNEIAIKQREITAQNEAVMKSYNDGFILKEEAQKSIADNVKKSIALNQESLDGYKIANDLALEKNAISKKIYNLNKKEIDAGQKEITYFEKGVNMGANGENLGEFLSQERGLEQSRDLINSRKESLAAQRTYLDELLKQKQITKEAHKEIADGIAQQEQIVANAERKISIYENPVIEAEVVNKKNPSSLFTKAKQIIDAPLTYNELTKEADFYSNAKDYAKAEPLFQQAVEKAPVDSKEQIYARSQLAKTLYQSGKYTEASAQYDLLIKEYNSYPEKDISGLLPEFAVIEKANAEALAGDSAKAIKDLTEFEKTAKLIPPETIKAEEEKLGRQFLESADPAFIDTNFRAIGVPENLIAEAKANPSSRYDIAKQYVSEPAIMAAGLPPAKAPAEALSYDEFVKYKNNFNLIFGQADIDLAKQRQLGEYYTRFSNEHPELLKQVESGQEQVRQIISQELALTRQIWQEGRTDLTAQRDTLTAQRKALQETTNLQLYEAYKILNQYGADVKSIGEMTNPIAAVNIFGEIVEEKALTPEEQARINAEAEELIKGIPLMPSELNPILPVSAEKINDFYQLVPSKEISSITKPSDAIDLFAEDLPGSELVSKINFINPGTREFNYDEYQYLLTKKLGSAGLQTEVSKELISKGINPSTATKDNIYSAYESLARKYNIKLEGKLPSIMNADIAKGEINLYGIKEANVIELAETWSAEGGSPRTFASTQEAADYLAASLRESVIHEIGHFEYEKQLTDEQRKSWDDFVKSKPEIVSKFYEVYSRIYSAEDMPNMLGTEAFAEYYTSAYGKDPFRGDVKGVLGDNIEAENLIKSLVNVAPVQAYYKSSLAAKTFLESATPEFIRTNFEALNIPSADIETAVSNPAQRYDILVKAGKDPALLMGGLPAKATSAEVAKLIEDLKSEDKYVKQNALRELGEIKDSRSASAIAQLLKDPDVYTRLYAIEAIDKMGLDAKLLVIMDINEALKDSDSNIKSFAFSIIEEVKDPRSIPTLIELLTYTPLSGSTNYAEISQELLIEFGESAVPALIEASKYESGFLAISVRSRAVEALGKIGGARVVPALIEALKDSDENVRRYAADALIKIGKPSVQPLIESLKDSDEGVRQNAVIALGQIGDKNAVPALIGLLKDSNVGVRQSAIIALGNIGDERAVQPLIEALKDYNADVRSDVAKTLRRNAAEALGKIGEPSVLPLIEELKGLPTCLDASRVLVKIGEPAVEPLIKALNNPNVNTRKYAASILGEIGDARAIGPLAKLLEEPDMKLEAIVPLNMIIPSFRFSIDEINPSEKGIKIISEYLQNEQGKINSNRIYIYADRLNKNAEQISSITDSAKRWQEIKKVTSQADKDYLAFTGEAYYNNKVSDYSLYTGTLSILDAQKYKTDLGDIAKTLKISIEGKSTSQLIQEIDSKVPNVEIKEQYVDSFDFAKRNIELKLPEDYELKLKSTISGILDAQEVDLNELKIRVSDVNTKVDTFDINYLNEQKVPQALISQAQKDPAFKENIKAFLYKKIELTPEQTSTVLSKTFDRIDRNLIKKYNLGKLTTEETNLFLQKMSESEIALGDTMTDLGLKELYPKAKGSDQWSVFKDLKINLKQFSQKQAASVSKIDLVFKQKNALDLFQGKFSGTCFGDHPYDMAREDIFVMKILEDGDLGGSVLFNIQKDKLIMLGFDPSESLVSGLDTAKQHEFVDEVMTRVYDFADRNNYKLLITEQAGGLSNRGLGNYILDKYPTKNSVNLESRTYHPNYKYKVISAFEAKAIAPKPVKVYVPGSDVLEKSGISKKVREELRAYITLNVVEKGKIIPTEYFDDNILDQLILARKEGRRTFENAKLEIARILETKGLESTDAKDMGYKAVETLRMGTLPETAPAAAAAATVQPITEVKITEKVEDIPTPEIEQIKEHATLLQIKDDTMYPTRITSLVAVHGTDYFPEEGKIKPVMTIVHPEDYSTEQVKEMEGARKTVHFSLNHLYGGATMLTGSHPGVEARKYFIVVPLSDLAEINTPLGGAPTDFFFAGDVKLPKTAKIFTSPEEAEKYISEISSLRESGQYEWWGDETNKEIDAIAKIFEEKDWWFGLHGDYWSASLEDVFLRQIEDTGKKDIPEAFRELSRYEFSISEKLSISEQQLRAMGYNPDELPIITIEKKAAIENSQQFQRIQKENAPAAAVEVPAPSTII